ncbi:hypothetical protein G9A89_001060 [Geosiphon pyriformis]|nr:hypothetical protein G9A89_001060 [Geosiphon pyriformis]
MSKLTAISSISVYKDVNLHWAGLFLACCVQYKQFGHIFVDCSMGGNSGNYGRHVVNLQDQICLANIYKKKQAPIMHSVLFGGKTWAQIASGSPFCVISLVLSGAVSISVRLRGLLDKHLNLLCKQANKDCWKFDIKNADKIK